MTGLTPYSPGCAADMEARSSPGEHRFLVTGALEGMFRVPLKDECMLRGLQLSGRHSLCADLETKESRDRFCGRLLREELSSGSLHQGARRRQMSNFYREHQ